MAAYGVEGYGNNSGLTVGGINDVTRHAIKTGGANPLSTFQQRLGRDRGADIGGGEGRPGLMDAIKKQAIVSDDRVAFPAGTSRAKSTLSDTTTGGLLEFAGKHGIDTSNVSINWDKNIGGGDGRAGLMDAIKQQADVSDDRVAFPAGTSRAKSTLSDTTTGGLLEFAGKHGIDTSNVSLGGGPAPGPGPNGAGGGGGPLSATTGDPEDDLDDVIARRLGGGMSPDALSNMVHNGGAAGNMLGQMLPASARHSGLGGMGAGGGGRPEAPPQQQATAGVGSGVPSASAAPTNSDVSHEGHLYDGSGSDRWAKVMSGQPVGAGAGGGTSGSRGRLGGAGGSGRRRQLSGLGGTSRGGGFSGGFFG